MHPKGLYGIARFLVPKFDCSNLVAIQDPIWPLSRGFPDGVRQLKLSRQNVENLVRRQLPE